MVARVQRHGLVNIPALFEAVNILAQLSSHFHALTE